MVVVAVDGRRDPLRAPDLHGSDTILVDGGRAGASGGIPAGGDLSGRHLQDGGLPAVIGSSVPGPPVIAGHPTETGERRGREMAVGRGCGECPGGVGRSDERDRREIARARVDDGPGRELSAGIGALSGVDHAVPCLVAGLRGAIEIVVAPLEFTSAIVASPQRLANGGGLALDHPEHRLLERGRCSGLDVGRHSELRE